MNSLAGRHSETPPAFQVCQCSPGDRIRRTSSSYSLTSSVPWTALADLEGRWRFSLPASDFSHSVLCSRSDPNNSLMTQAADNLTFLFSDIEGSTRLWEEQPDTMRPALSRHDALMQAAIEAAGGSVFKTVGDAFHAVFEQSGAALEAAFAAQTALHREPWPLTGGKTLRVRLALHTGAAEQRSGDYFGPALNQTARLLSAGHGGQTLISESAAALLPALLPPSVRLRSLGRHRLKDLAQAQEIWEMLAPGIPDNSPPLRSLDSFPHNLPSQLTSFIGRETEMAAARECLATARLLTIVGTGGSGKTRLALQVAAEVMDRYPGRYLAGGACRTV